MRHKKGFIATTTALIISTLMVTIAMGMALRSVGESKMILNAQVFKCH